MSAAHRRLHLLLLVMLLLVFMGSVFVSTASAQGGVSAERFARLSRCVSLSDWFWRTPATYVANPAHYTEGDIQLLKQMGVTCVRVGIEFTLIYDATRSDRMKPNIRADYEAMLAMLARNDMAAYVYIHSMDITRSPDFSYGLPNNPTRQQDFINFWSSFAARLNAITSPELVFILPLNEPVFENAYDQWYPLQDRLLAAIRQQAPNHTLIAVAPEWQNLERLAAMTPVSDPNVVYDFHYYRAFVFTHQNTPWAGYSFGLIRNLPYPSTPENVAPVRAGITDPYALYLLDDYGNGRWNIDKIRGEIRAAANWAASHGGLRVMCSEFGAVAAAPRADRLRWLSDMRTVLEGFGMGWGLWNYNDDTFGFVSVLANGTRQIDVGFAQALGLTIPSPATATPTATLTPTPTSTATATATPTATSTSTATATATSTNTPLPTGTLQATLALQGRGAPSTAMSVQLTVELYAPGGTTPVAVYTPTTDVLGAFSIGSVTPGTYVVWVKGPGYLSERAANVVITSGTTTAAFAALRAGDSNSDDSVDLADLGLLARAYDAGLGQPAYNARADFNADGFVDLADLGLLARNYDAVGAPRSGG